MRSIFEIKFVLMFLGQALQHTVEDVVVSLIWVLMNYSRFLKQILVNLGSLNDSILVEVDVDVLSKSRRVVISHSLCVAESLKDRVCFEDLLLDPGVLPADGGQVLEDQLGALRLPGPRLPADDDALVLA